ncbi:MAG TPA: sodium:solute symporter [Verrucomicrobiae bacterium]|nr:sodium:solute symporter [Verrucomicrobiae bacterium]
MATPMNQYLSFADWAVIVLYLLGMIALGVWFGKDQRNARDYFLGSRNLPWWSVGLSIIATETSALTFIGVPALVFGGDISFIQVVIGYVIARVILAILMVPHYFKGEIYSPYQLVADAFGEPSRRVVSVFFLIAGTLAAGVRVYVTCIPLQLMLGVNVLPAIILFIVLSLVYTYVGGIKAVVWTEFAQFILFMMGGLFTLFYIPTLLEGGWSGALKEAAEGGKLHWLNTGFSLAKPYNIWMGLIGATVFVMSSHGADQLIVQRVLTCRNVTEGRKALLLSAVVILPLFLVFLFVGSLLWVYYQHHGFAIPLPETKAGFSKNDYVFPIFILSAVPPVVKGFMIVAILAAAMSSVSAALAALASVSTMDIFKALAKRPLTDETYLRLSKHSTLGWAVILGVVAFASQGVEFILNWAFSLNGLTSGAMLGGLLLAIFWRQTKPAAVVAGMMVSLAGMIALSQFSWTTEVGGDKVEQKVFWPWFTLIGATLTLGAAWTLHQFLPNNRNQPSAR